MNPLLRFSQGVRYFLAGLRMMFRYPKLLGLALIPILATVVVLLGLAWGSAWLVGELLWKYFRLEADGRIFLQAIILLVTLFVAYLIYLPLTRIFLAPFSEKLSHKTCELNGAIPLTENEFGTFKAIWEGVKLVAFQIVVIVFAMILSVVFPPIGVPSGIIVTIAFCGIDFVDVPLSVRGMSFRQKLRFLWQHAAHIFGFAIAAYLLLHIPVVNLLVLPVGVIGATLLVNQVVSESAGKWAGE